MVHKHFTAISVCLLSLAPVSVLAQSALGSFVGDCFQLVESDGSEATYAVTQQEPAGGDMKLTLVQGSVSLVPVPGKFGCKPAVMIGDPTNKTHGELMKRGARRYGWAYGALTMPYKYYTGSKGFQAGVPIGGYLGYRVGQMGSGYTAAVALTLSQVKADTLDPDTLDAEGRPTVTGHTDVAALSWALGLVFDVGKDPTTKAFKAGVFVGRDRVNTSPSISYKHNGKTYIAVQLGFDFTD